MLYWLAVGRLVFTLTVLKLLMVLASRDWGTKLQRINIYANLERQDFQTFFFPSSRHLSLTRPSGPGQSWSRHVQMSVCQYVCAIGCSFFGEVFFTSPQIWGGVCVCGGGGCHVSCVTCHMSHVTCHMSRVTCHVSHVTCHVSHVTCHFFLLLFFFFF